MKKKSVYEIGNDGFIKHFDNFCIEHQLKHGVRLKKVDMFSMLGEFCYCSSEVIRFIYRGVNAPTIGTALKISEFFNVPVNNLFNVNNVNKDGFKIKKCKFCERHVVALEMCAKHYDQQRNNILTNDK